MYVACVQYWELTSTKARKEQEGRNPAYAQKVWISELQNTVSLRINMYNPIISSHHIIAASAWVRQVALSASHDTRTQSPSAQSLSDDTTSNLQL